jgi:hypothetical protein
MGRAVGQTMTAAGIWWGDAERRGDPHGGPYLEPNAGGP